MSTRPRRQSRQLTLTELLSIAFIVVLLLIVFRSALAPLVALAPGAIGLVVAQGLIAQTARWGAPTSDLTGDLLIVVLLGVGTDYGLFLIFRVREELERGAEMESAILEAVARVGEALTLSAVTVMAAFSALLFATFGLYRGLGPALVIGIAVVLVADLTLLPAVLAIVREKTFWPSQLHRGGVSPGGWGRASVRVIRRPVLALTAGVAVLGALALFTLDYAPGGFLESNPPPHSDAAQGMAALSAHFGLSTNPTEVIFSFPAPVWIVPDVLSRAQQALQRAPEFRSVVGPLDPNGTTLSSAELNELHHRLGPAARLSVVPPARAGVSVAQYDAYRAAQSFISPDGFTVSYDTTLRSGGPDSDAAMSEIPAVRATVAHIGSQLGAVADGVAGDASGNYDEADISTQDLEALVPLVLAVMLIILVVRLRSLVAPLYMIVSVALSYLAALGMTILVFSVIGGSRGVEFVLPFLLFVFLLALGEDYNILVMTRIREETRRAPLHQAVATAMARTGTTVTSAGLILAGTFVVLTVTTTGETRQIGVGLAAGILLDTFLVRTLLLPALVVILGRRSWWPSTAPP